MGGVSSCLKAQTNIGKREQGFICPAFLCVSGTPPTHIRAISRGDKVLRVGIP